MFVEGDHSQGLASSQGHAGHAAGDVNPKGFTPRSRQNSGIFTIDDHNAMMRSLHNGRRPPQRSRTTHEHIPNGPQVLKVTMAPSHHRYHAPSQAHTNVPAQESVKNKAAYANEAQQQQQQQDLEKSDSVGPLAAPLHNSSHHHNQHPRRPKLGAPRRSYSVMDYEPVPPEQRPASGPLTLQTLPSELHYALFDFLDPIDATCLGLTNHHFYDIHMRMHGPVPLSVRRDGPNELEWAWHRAAYPSPSVPTSMAMTPSPATSGSGSGATTPRADGADKAGHLAALRVRGKGLCRKCGVSRCELHKHIVDWMPADYEYCSVRDKFVPRPGEEARVHCYMSNPTNTTRCGRHRIRKDKKTTA